MRPRVLLSPGQLLMVLGLTIGASGLAQGDRGSLTEQFPKMSAKERARIAAREEEEARNDASYQEVMGQAERSFQQGRYEEAIRQYEQARALRPYNVYPKVKIEDLRALIARQEAENRSADVPEEEHAVDPDPVIEERIERPEPVPLPDAQPEPTPAAPERQPSHEPEIAPPIVPAHALSTPPAMKPADGIIEHRYREGHAYVIERAVTIEGRLVKYKRVYHPYGQVFYFEDGLSVDERVWKARFPER